MKTLFLAALILSIAVAGYAIRVNPGSQASGDSANTAETLVYRDTNGAFSAGAITATSISVSAQASPMKLQARTKAQFSAITPALGDMYRCSDCTEKLICIATGTALGDFQRSDSETIGCGTGE